MKLGIRNKMILINASVVLFTVVVIGLLTYWISSSLISDNFIKSNREMNHEIAHSIENEFAGYMNGLKMVALNNNTKTIASEGFDGWRKDVFKTYLDSFARPFQIYIGLDNGTIHIQPPYEFDDSYDPRERSWYKGVMETGGDFWTNVYTDVVTGKFAISAATPVLDNANRNIGVLGTSIALDVLAEQISKIEVGEAGYVFILDSQGVTVAHPNPDILGTPLEVPEVQEAIKTEEHGIVYYDYMNPVTEKIEKKYAVFDKIEGLNWFVLTSMYVSEVKSQASSIIFYTIIIAAVVMVISILVGIYFASSMTKPIKGLLVAMDAVAGGDMTVASNVKSHDEIGHLSDQFNNMIDNIRSLIQNASAVSEEVGTAAQTLAAASEETSASSDEVAKTVGEIAEGATDQAHEAEDASRLAVNLDEKFTKLIDNSNQISSNADVVKGVNYKGMGVVNELKTKSEQNHKATIEISDAIMSLNQKSSDIGGIIETIQSIAEQTNLLSLNASIEAARAGEHGRGFAVVAGEIRKLAEESSSSAEEIQKIIHEIQIQTQDTVTIMSSFKENANSQYESVGDVNRSFEEILNSVEGIVDQITAVHHFIGEMIQDKDKIVDAITNISSVSEETAAASQEVSATMDQQTMAVESVAHSAEKLNELSISLRSEIGKFKIE